MINSGFPHFIFSFSLFSSFQQNKTSNDLWKESYLSLRSERNECSQYSFFYANFSTIEDLTVNILQTSLGSKVCEKWSSCSSRLSPKYQHTVWPGPRRYQSSKNFYYSRTNNSDFFFPFVPKGVLTFYIFIVRMLTSLWLNPSKWSFTT